MNMEDELARLLLIHGDNFNTFLKILTSPRLIFQDYLVFEEHVTATSICHDIDITISKRDYDGLMDAYSFVKKYYEIKITMLIQSDNSEFGTATIKKEMKNDGRF